MLRTMPIPHTTPAHAGRTTLYNLALFAPGLDQVGVERTERHFLFHWPTLWSQQAGFLAPALGISPFASCEDAIPALEAALPGRPVRDPDLLSPRGLDPTLSAVCEAPFCGAYLGLLPERWSHAQSIAQLPWGLQQLLHAVEDLGRNQGPDTTGVYADPLSPCIVVNWTTRSLYHPAGDEMHPFRSTRDNPINMNQALGISIDVRSVVHAVSLKARSNAVERSPRPDMPSVLTVFNICDLIDQYHYFRSRKPVKVRGRFVWSRSLDPQVAGVDPLETSDTSVAYFRSWAKDHKVKLLPYKAVWLRKQWAMTVPFGFFSGRYGDETLTAADETAVRDAYIVKYQHQEHPRTKKLLPAEVVRRFLQSHAYEYGGDTYYTAKALVPFVQAPPHFFLFDFLRGFLCNQAKPENQEVIASPEQREKRRRPYVPKQGGRARAPNWTPEEDIEIRRYFAPRATDADPSLQFRPVTDEEWEFMLNSPYSKIRECHRTKKHVLERIFSINQKLRRDCMVNGEFTLESRARYLLARLGQRTRHV